MSMTDEQIVKALECCSTARAVKCHDCAYCGKDLDKHCTFVLTEDALNFIKRQQAEIDDLREIIFTDRTEAIKKLKAEAIREFAERLKKWKYQSSDWSHGEHPFVVEETDIDDLVIEMTEERK